MKTTVSFRFSIIQAFILFSLLLAGAITYNFHQRFSDAMLELSQQVNDHGAHRIIEVTRDYLGAPASYTTVVAKFLETGGKQDALVKHHEELWQLMWGPLLITPQLQSLFYADEAGSYVQVRRDPEFSTRLIDRDKGVDGPANEFRVARDEYFHRITERNETTDYDPRARDWYQEVNRKEPITWSGPFISATFKTPSIAASSPILDPDGNVRGVASVNIPAYGISQELSEMPLAPHSVMLAVDEEYRLLAHPLKSKLLGLDAEGKPRVSRLEELGSPYTELRTLLAGAAKGETRLELHAQGGDYRVFVQPFRESFGKPGWRLVGMVPRPEPSKAEMAFDDYAKKVFALLEKPAVEARELATSFKREREPLKLGAIHESLWEKMWKPLTELPHLQSFVIGDAQGSFVQARREPFLGTRLIDRGNPTAEPVERKIYRDEEYQILSDRTGPAEFDPRSRPWYAAAVPNNRILWSEPHLSSSASLPVVSATLAVARPDGGKAGMVSANIPLYKVSDFVAQAKVSQGSQTMIVDKLGQVVAYPDKTQLVTKDASGTIRLRTVEELEDPPMREAYHHLAANPGEQRFLFSHDQGRFIGVVQRFPESVGQKDWSILTVMPEEDLSGRVWGTLIETAVITAVILLLGTIVLYFIASALARPLGRLADGIEGLKEYRLDPIEEVPTRFREVERIGQSLRLAQEGLGAYEKYVPVDLVRQLIQTRQFARLGGEETPLALLFSNVDLVTARSENPSGYALMHHISEYLEAMSEIILHEQGTFENHLGGTMMAFWGAPAEIDHAPVRACSAALRCLERERLLNRQWEGAGKPLVRTRFGIHCGTATVGNVSAHRRLNYTAIGENVDFAAHLPEINKLYGVSILVSGATYRLVKASFHFRLLDRVALPGMKSGIDIYELLATADNRLAPDISQFRDRYHLALKTYWRREWGRAAAMFEELAREYPEDRAVRLLLKRCQHLRQKPDAIGQAWDGTNVLPDA